MALSKHGIDAFDIDGPGAPKRVAPVKSKPFEWQLNCRVDERIRKPLKVACAVQGVSIGNYVQPLILEKLESTGAIDRATADRIRADQGAGN